MKYSPAAFLLALFLTIPAWANETTESATLKVFVFLDQPSLAEAVALYRTETRLEPNSAWQKNHVSKIDRQQLQVRQNIAPLILKEHSALKIALNGFRATVRRQDLAALRRTQGIKAVSPVRSLDLDNIYSVKWVEAPKIWQNFGDGEGMTIAVIDTGIDYLHRNFGGNGISDEFASNDPSFIEANTFPTAKVVGGWDFAGPTYNSRLDEEPEPDPDPLDLHGHGSHVAGTAGGLGVPNKIGPGVAKGSSLLALKVFSDIGGSTDLTVDAIDRALDPNQDGSMDDRVDVINMSLGARFGLPTDPSAIASTNAVNAGVVVVASAGNNGDLPYVVGSPGVAENVITVAASISGGRRQIALSTQIDGSTELLPALEGAGPVKLTEKTHSRVVKLARGLADDVSNDDLGENSFACTPLIEPQTFNNKFVLATRGGCNFPAKYHTAQAAGAAGIVIINLSDEVTDLFVMGGLDNTIAIPGIMITQSDGQRLIDALDAQPDSLIASLSTTITTPTPILLNDTLASFTSQGPAGGQGFKPDLTAPGRFIFSTAAGTGDEGVERRGTSMAAPHVAGMAALIKQRFPEYSPAMIKSMLMNASSPSNIDGPDTNTPFPVTRQGVGVLRGGQAMLSKAVTLPAGVSFGYLNPLSSQSQHREVVLNNLSDSTTQYTVSHHTAVSIPGVTVDCPDDLEIAPLSEITFDISLTIDSDSLPNDDAKFSFNEISGWCVLDDGDQPLRVAYMASVDAASNIVLLTTRSRSLASGSKTQNEQISLENLGPGTGYADSFLLSAQQESSADQAFSISAFGWRSTEKFGFPLFEFAIALDTTWDNPSNYRYYLYLDTDQDLEEEMVLFGLDWSVLGFDPGMIVTGYDDAIEYEDVGGESSVSQWFVQNGDYNNNVIVLPYFNSASGANTLFKPNVTILNYRLLVVDRNANTDEVSGQINLNNAMATQQHSFHFDAGDNRIFSKQKQPQLWIIPNNQAQHQHFAVE